MKTTNIAQKACSTRRMSDAHFIRARDNRAIMDAQFMNQSLQQVTANLTLAVQQRDTLARKLDAAYEAIAAMKSQEAKP